MTENLAIGFFILAFIAMISTFAFWKENYVLFMVAAGVSMISGLYGPDLINGQYETTGYGIAFGFALLVYSLICCGFTFRLMFWSDE